MQRCLARLSSSLLPLQLPFPPPNIATAPLSLQVQAPLRFCVRGLVSPAFHCNEEWNRRLGDEIFDKLKSSDGRSVSFSSPSLVTSGYFQAWGALCGDGQEVHLGDGWLSPGR